MRRKIFALAYDADIIWGDTKEDKQMNIAKLNKFLVDKGTVKKELNKMNHQELVKVVSQFTMIKKHNQASIVSNDTKEMLSSIGISTSKKGAKNPI
jgi:hypothetical protein